MRFFKEGTKLWAHSTISAHCPFLRTDKQEISLSAFPENHQSESQSRAENRHCFVPKNMCTWNRATKYLIGISALCNTIMFALLWIRTTPACTTYALQTFIPEVGEETIVFKQDSPFEEAPSQRSDEAWESIMPDGEGFIIVEDPKTFDLPLGMPSKYSHNGYGVTWTHQYHCLQMLRNQCWDGIGNRSGFSGIEGVDGSEAEKRVHHIGHCLDCLRQGILCNMDTTIEWPGRGADGVGTGLHVDGYNIPHHCKRREAILAFMSMHSPS